MNSSSPVVCREIFDENSQPSLDEITDYAHQLGIDPSSESHLLQIAKDGLMQALPQPWRAYYDEKLKTHYYYNTDTKQTQWDHPLDNIYKDLVSKARVASEREHSIHDDTYASVQDLLTSEEVSKYFTLGKNDGKEEVEEDFSTDGSMEENGSEPKYKPNSNLRSLSEKKPLPILGPIKKLTNKKLSSLKASPLRRSMDSSLPLKAVVEPKFAFSTERVFDDNRIFSSQHSEDHKIKSFQNRSFDTTNSEHEKASIIDLSINLSRKSDNIFNPLQSIKSEKGLLFSGGGSMFLKSKKDNEDKPASLEVNQSLQATEPPKSILREKTLDLSEKFTMAARVACQTSLPDYQLVNMEDDKKSVRFNLEQKEIDIQFDFSQSPSSNSSSDLGHDKQNSIISNLGVTVSTKNTPENNSLKIGNENLASLPPKPNRNVKLLPIMPPAHTGAEFYKDLKSKPLPSQDSVDAEDKLDSSQYSLTDSKSPSSSGNKRVLKPPAADFIKPNLFQKQFDKIADIIKPISIDSDSDSDIKPRPRSPMNPQKSKISINLMESIESETSIDSPDKEFADIDLNHLHETNDLENQSNQHVQLQSQMISEKEVDEYKKCRRAELEETVHKEMVQLSQILRNKKEAEEKELRENMHLEVETIKKNMQQEKSAAIEKKKKELEEVYENNKNELEKEISIAKQQHQNKTADIINGIQIQLSGERDDAIKQLRQHHEANTRKTLEEITKDKLQELQQLQNDKNDELHKAKQKLEQENLKAITEMSSKLHLELEEEKRNLQLQNKEFLDKMRSQHEAVCDEIRKDYRTEVELLRSQHLCHLSQLKERLEAERRRTRDTEDNSYDKLKNEKRLLEDKYRCLKEKYIRLKTDIKMSLERRNRRREQSMTTGSETERSNSNKTGQAIDKLKEDVDLSIITSLKSELKGVNNNPVIKCQNDNETSLSVSYRTSHNNNTSRAENSSESRTNKVDAHHLTVESKNGNISDRSSDISRSKSPILCDKSPIGKVMSRKDVKYKNSTDNELSIGLNDTSMSQSELSHTASKGKSNKLTVAFSSDVDKVKKKDSFKKGSISKNTMIHKEKAMTDYHDSSDTANDTTDLKNKDSNHGRNRKKSFTRSKSASTSRLNYSPKHGERSCSPVENLKQQLRKLEELEEQFPDLTLNVDQAGYRLPYPFADLGESVERCTSAPPPELEFVAHRALVERERVRRARAALRRRRTALRERRRAAPAASPAAQHPHQAWQEERDLTDSEVSLHRTRAMLGEKVIRLRHIEKMLRNMTTGSSDDASPDKSVRVEQKKDKHDLTLSDISSQSSGFSSNDAPSDNNMQQVMKREIGATGAAIYEQSDEIISSLENLNTEIRDIWQVLNVQQRQNLSRGLPTGQMFYGDFSFPMVGVPGEAAGIPNVSMQPIPGVVQHMPGVVQHMPSGAQHMPSVAPHIPTLADRLHTYRQLTSNTRPTGMAATFVTSRAQANGGVATSLVEKTKDLREWLKQQTSL